MIYSVDYVQEMQERIGNVTPIVKEHMQAEQPRIYNLLAEPRHLSPAALPQH